MWGKELPIILPQGGPLSPPVRPRHFTLGCDLTGGHASLVVQSEAPFLPLNPPAASGERHHRPLGRGTIGVAVSMFITGTTRCPP